MDSHDREPEPEVQPGSDAQHRLLAAVLFTDAVAFSKLAGRDEQAAFRILNRDFAMMTSICGSHGGRVLNTMGDGMLMVFPSAVEAMQCALRIQQSLYAQSKTLPTVSVLQHRMGVHLGDIIIDGANVFGDGVNVASRLQTECKPGAITYSRMVGDVIRNKVTVKSRFLGAKHLKNIAEPVPVYEIPPLAEYDTSADPIDTVTVESESDGVAGSKAILLVAASLALVGLAAFAVIKFTGKGNELEKRLTVGNTRIRTPSATPTLAPTATPSPGPGTPSVDLGPLRARYDFAAMVDASLRDPSKAAMVERYRDLAGLRSWLEAEMSLATQTVAVSALIGGRNARCYRGTRGLVVESPAGINETSLIELAPADWIALADALRLQPLSGQPAPTALPKWLDEFRSEYGA